MPSAFDYIERKAKVASILSDLQYENKDHIITKLVDSDLSLKYIEDWIKSIKKAKEELGKPKPGVF